MEKEKYLLDMYNDDYYPTFLVDKIKTILLEIEETLKSGEKDLDIIQKAFDSGVLKINELQEDFYENDSDLETVARESIGETVYLMLEYYGIDLDVEDAIEERDW